VSLVLALEPDPKQAAVLKQVVRDRVGAQFVLADSKDAALAAIAERVPDLILVTTLLSPRDESELTDRLRELEGAEHLQTLTIPLLAAAGTPAEPKKKRRGLLSAFTSEAEKPAAPGGCDPAVFAEEIRNYIARAEELKATASVDRERKRASRKRKSATPAEPSLLIRSADAVRVAESATSETGLPSEPVSGPHGSYWAWDPAAPAKPAERAIEPVAEEQTVPGKPLEGGHSSWANPWDVSAASVLVAPETRGTAVDDSPIATEGAGSSVEPVAPSMESTAGAWSAQARAALEGLASAPAASTYVDDHVIPDVGNLPLVADNVADVLLDQPAKPTAADLLAEAPPAPSEEIDLSALLDDGTSSKPGEESPQTDVYTLSQDAIDLNAWLDRPVIAPVSEPPAMSDADRAAMVALQADVDRLRTDRESVESALAEARAAQERAEVAAAEAAQRARDEVARHQEELAARVRQDAAAERKARERDEQKARDEADRRMLVERQAREEFERLTHEVETRVREEAAAERRLRERAEQAAREAESARERDAVEREARENAERQARAQAEAQAATERRAREEAEARAAAERVAREQAEQKAREQAERVAREADERRLKDAAELKAREEAERKAREEIHRKAREDAEALARAAEERRLREAAELKAREEAERKAREHAEALARAAEERRLKEAAELKAREGAERKAREHAEALARAADERRLKDAAEMRAREEAERKGRQEAEARAAAERKAREAAEQRAREHAEAVAREAEARRAREALELQAREDAARQAREDAEARVEVERKARKDAERQAKLEAAKRAEMERKTREEAERLASETAARAREEARAERKARQEAEARAAAERKAREQAERRVREETSRRTAAEARAKQEAERRAREASRPRKVVVVKKARRRPAPEPVRAPKKDPSRPTQDEWGLYDPDKAGFGALFAKLDAIDNEPVEEDPSAADLLVGTSETTRSSPRPLSMWVWRADHGDTAAAVSIPADDFRGLVDQLNLPAAVAAVRYASGVRIRRVKITPGTKPAKGKHDESRVIILSRKLLKAVRAESGDAAEPTKLRRTA
jgi:CheY-like chemotaxis protein